MSQISNTEAVDDELDGAPVAQLSLKPSAKLVGAAIAPETFPDVVNKKLKNPTLKLSPSEQLECLTSCINCGAFEVTKAKDKDIHIFIGNTGAGKSTLVNYLHGCELERFKIEGNKKVIRVKPNSSTPELMKIGHSNQSMTFIPDVEPDSNFVYCDCPGFLDSRGAEINIANAVNIKQTIHAARSVRVVVMLNFHSLKADRGKGVRELTKILSDLFGSADRLVEFVPSIILGVSQVPLMDDEDKMELEDVQGLVCDIPGANPEIADVISKLSETMFLYHPMDKGNDTWLKREEVIQRIQSVSKIYEPERIFQTVLNADDERMLRYLVDTLGHIVEQEMDNKNYEIAQERLKQMDMISCVDNIIVERLLKTAKDRVNQYTRSLEQKGMNYIASGAFADAEALCVELDRIGSGMADIPGLVDAREMATSTRGHAEKRKEEFQQIQDLNEKVKNISQENAELEGTLEVTAKELNDMKEEHDSLVKKAEENSAAFEAKKVELEAHYSGKLLPLQMELESEAEGTEKKALLASQIEALLEEWDKEKREAAITYEQQGAVFTELMDSQAAKLKAKESDLESIRSLLAEKESERNAAQGAYQANLTELNQKHVAELTALTAQSKAVEEQRLKDMEAHKLAIEEQQKVFAKEMEELKEREKTALESERRAIERERQEHLQRQKEFEENMMRLNQRNERDYDRARIDRESNEQQTAKAKEDSSNDGWLQGLLTMGAAALSAGICIATPFNPATFIDIDAANSNSSALTGLCNGGRNDLLSIMPAARNYKHHPEEKEEEDICNTVVEQLAQVPLSEVQALVEHLERPRMTTGRIIATGKPRQQPVEIFEDAELLCESSRQRLIHLVDYRHSRQLQEDIKSEGYNYIHDNLRDPGAKFKSADKTEKLKKRNDFIAELSKEDILEIIGATQYEKICECFQGSFDTIKIRRTEARGDFIPFHKDYSKKTMQIALNDDDDYEGGRLVFATANGFQVPKRAAGSATIHTNSTVHGVTAMGSGVRYGLFFCDTSQNLSQNQGKSQPQILQEQQRHQLGLTLPLKVSSNSMTADTVDLTYLVESVSAQFAFFQRAVCFIDDATDEQLSNIVMQYSRYMEGRVISSTASAPSFPVELAWRVHLLHPRIYQQACATLLQGLVGDGSITNAIDSLDDTSSSTRTTGTCVSMDSWDCFDHVPERDDVYHDDETEVIDIPDEPESSSSSSSSSYTGDWIGLDLVSAIRRQGRFMQQILAQQQVLTSKTALASAINHYRNFLALVGRVPNLVPTPLIDLIWHTHQQFPSRYARECLIVAGTCVDHDDDDACQATIANDFEETKRVWEDTYGHAYY